MKYEIGTQWKTRGGWRAMVVDIPERGGSFLVWHSNQPQTPVSHALVDGSRVQSCGRIEDADLYKQGYDLIEPWSEPVIHEFFVNFYDSDYVSGFTTRGAANNHADNEMRHQKRIACIKIKFTEGEGL